MIKYSWDCICCCPTLPEMTGMQHVRPSMCSEATTTLMPRNGKPVYLIPFPSTGDWGLITWQTHCGPPVFVQTGCERFRAFPSTPKSLCSTRVVNITNLAAANKVTLTANTTERVVAVLSSSSHCAFIVFSHKKCLARQSFYLFFFWWDYQHDSDLCWSVRLVPGNDDIHLETAALGSQSGTPIITAVETSGQQRFYPSSRRCGTHTSSVCQNPGQQTAAPGCFYIYSD